MFHNFWLLSSLLWISQLMVSCFGIGANFLRWPQQCWGKWWRSGCGAEKMSALFELQQLDLKPLPLLPPCQCTFWTATAKPCTPPSPPCPSPSLWTIFNCVGSLNSRFMLLAAHFGLKLQNLKQNLKQHIQNGHWSVRSNTATEETSLIYTNILLSLFIFCLM